MNFSTDQLQAFSQTFDSAYEEHALVSRGVFLQAFPLSSLKRLTLDRYVIGKGMPSFCSLAEVRTRAWANMQGATASKFGIYFGRTKSDPDKRYRFTQKFGVTAVESFRSVKAELLRLIASGGELDFQTIDENLLSQMFKAKVLSLYFPDQFINICSAEHLTDLASLLQLPEHLPISQYQHLILVEKTKDSTTRSWSNPKFMSFVYAKYLRKNDHAVTTTLSAPRKGAKKKIDFAALQAAWAEIGVRSEEFALEWERQRLLGLGQSNFVERIVDRREFPAYGYDFLSYNADGQERYIEVKSLGRDRPSGVYRFFLSENERDTSLSTEHAKNYYFYLVRFDGNGNPQELVAVPASRLYETAELRPCAHVVLIGLNPKPSSAA